VTQPDPSQFQARLAAGDPNVEQDIFRAYAKEMNQAAIKIFRSETRSVRGKSWEDAVNQACLEVHRKKLLQPNVENFAGLLVKVVTRRALDMVRPQKTELVSLDDVEPPQHDAGDAFEAVDDSVSAKQVYLESVDVVATMSDNERKVFHLLYRVGMTVAEIAAELNMTERGVRGIHGRVLTKLKRKLNVLEHTEGGRNDA
jgi:RNA polymerase sigma factor (sigma-70 family)